MREVTAQRVLDVAWMAGLYEGEGSLVRKVDRRNGNVTWELSLCLTDPDVLERFGRASGVGSVRSVGRQAEHWKEKYRWLVCRRDDIAQFLGEIRPYLGVRRGAKVDEFFEWYNALARVTRRKNGP